MIDDKFRSYLNRNNIQPLVDRVVHENIKPTHGSADRIYSFTNENIGEYLKDIDLEGKKVLTVGSSGEQVLHCAYKGAKEITLFDANIYAKFYVELKIASIKNLSLRQFLTYFTPQNILNSEYYDKVSHDLSPEVKYFWDRIMACDDKKKEEIKPRLFKYQVNEGTNKEELTMFNEGEFINNFYCSEKEYLKLREKLSNVNITYKTEKFDNILNATRGFKYDLILLSNVFDYVDRERYKYRINKLYSDHLLPHGRIQLNYFFKKDEGVKDFIAFISDKYLGKNRYRGKLKAIPVETPAIYVAGTYGEDGVITRKARDYMIEHRPYQTCLMLEK